MIHREAAIGTTTFEPELEKNSPRNVNYFSVTAYFLRVWQPVLKGRYRKRTIMRVAILRSAFCVAACWSGVSASWGSVEVGDVLQISNGPGAPGGIFQVDNVDDSGSEGFTTFCVQFEESVRLGDTYQVADIRREPVASGSRPLTEFAAWLYTNYLDQTLSNFKFSSPSGQAGNELQLAIWVSMGYTAADLGTSWYDASDTHLDAWQAEFAASGWTGFGEIYIMDLLGQDSSGEYTRPAQDQLVRISSASIPEPAGVFVWVGLTIGVATILFVRPRGNS